MSIQSSTNQVARHSFLFAAAILSVTLMSDCTAHHVAARASHKPTALTIDETVADASAWFESQLSAGRVPNWQLQLMNRMIFA